MLENLDKSSLLAFFDKKIDTLTNFPNIQTNSLDYISRVIDFGINTKDALSKQEYIEVIHHLQPLTEAYMLHIQENPAK